MRRILIMAAMSTSVLSGCAVAEKTTEAVSSAVSTAKPASSVDEAIANAKAAQKKAASVGGEWRDTGELIEEAEKLAKEGKTDDAMKLAEKARSEGELGYAQAVHQKEVAGMSQYFQ